MIQPEQIRWLTIQSCCITKRKTVIRVLERVVVPLLSLITHITQTKKKYYANIKDTNSLKF